MGSAVMMYVLPMLLGQTYDLGKEKSGLQIFPVSVVNKSTAIEHYFTDSQYRMVENTAQIRDFLDISGKLSLKIKSGLVDVSGEGQYVKDSASGSNGIEILVKVHFETITRTIPSSVEPNKDWNINPNKDFMGTHYCRSITYGGDLIASIRITATNSYDLEKIKGAINGGINAGGGSFNANVKAKLDMLKENAQDSSSMEINYYASVPLHGVSYTVEGLMKLIEDFPNQVKKVNQGMGNPLRMELYPLNSLASSIPGYFENRALVSEIEDLEDQFDDLRETRKRIGIWTTSLPPVAQQDVNQKIEKFTDKVNNIYGIYLKTIGDLDVSEGASTKPITDAFDAYKADEYIMPQKYIRQLTSLQKEIYDAHPELKPRIGGAEFTRWGSSECSSVESEAAVVGVITTSEIVQDGGSSDFFCSPVDPVQVNPTEYFPGYPGDYDPDDNLFFSPLRYRGQLNRFKAMRDKQMACVRCRTGHRTTTMTKLADTKCPEKWTKEYEGVLMAPGMHASKGQYVCMDGKMHAPDKEASFGNSDESHLTGIEEVAVECGSLPCGPYESGKPLPCVVCTI